MVLANRLQGRHGVIEGQVRLALTALATLGTGDHIVHRQDALPGRLDLSACLGTLCLLLLFFSHVIYLRY